MKGKGRACAKTRTIWPGEDSGLNKDSQAPPDAVRVTNA
jgi:hypothetical protein